VFKPNPTNLETAEEELVKKDSFYDWILHLVVPLQYALLYMFLVSMQDPTLDTWDRVGRITVMGILCGSFGINVAHELGHRVNRYEQTLAKNGYICFISEPLSWDLSVLGKLPIMNHVKKMERLFPGKMK